MGTIMSRFLRCSQPDDETITIGLKTTSWILKLDHYLGVFLKNAPDRLHLDHHLDQLTQNSEGGACSQLLPVVIQG